MKRIKKFNELFDDESLKSEFEIDYLRGDIKKDILSGKWPNVWSKNKSSAEALLEKLIRAGLHQLLLFILEPELNVKIRNWWIKESEIDQRDNKYDPNGIFHMFGLTKGKIDLIIGIKIYPNQTYDLLMVYEGPKNNDFSFSKMVRNMTFEQLYKYLRNNWLEFLSLLNVEELNDFGKDELNAFYN